MDVYDFLNLINDQGNLVVSIFDCDSEEVVLNTADSDGSSYPLQAVEEAGLDGFDVESMDLWTDGKGRIHIEINISMGDEEDE